MHEALWRNQARVLIELWALTGWQINHEEKINSNRVCCAMVHPLTRTLKHRQAARLLHYYNTRLQRKFLPFAVSFSAKTVLYPTPTIVGWVGWLAAFCWIKWNYHMLQHFAPPQAFAHLLQNRRESFSKVEPYYVMKRTRIQNSSFADLFSSSSFTSYRI